MHVYLDDKQLTRDWPTFASGLQAGADEAARSGRVIVEAQLDGSAVAEDILERPPEETLGDELRLVSVDPRELVRVTLMDAADALDSAREQQERCAELIQTGKVEESLAPLSAALQTWQAVKDAVEKSAALLHLPLDTITLPGGVSGSESLVELIGALAGNLESVKRSLASQDWSGLADLMAYDLSDQARRWKQVMASLSDSLKDG
jgi:hypothetical protein